MSSPTVPGDAVGDRGPTPAAAPEPGTAPGPLVLPLARLLTGRRGAVVTWVALWLWTAGWGWNRRPHAGVSWHFFVDGTRALFGGSGLHLYAQHPDLQIGPPAFVVVELLGPLSPSGQRVVAQVLMTAALPLMLWLLAPLVPGWRVPDGGPGVAGWAVGSARLRLLLGGLVLAPTWTVLSVRWMHLEDALALLLSVLAVRLVAVALHQDGARRAAPVAGLALGIAVAAKPWAVGFVPILLVLPAGQWLVAAAAALAAWGPFLLVDGATLNALRPPVGVSDSSGLWTLGYRGEVVPSWGRTAQLVLAPVAGLGAVLRRRWPGALVAAVAVRLALDPQDIAYYAAGAVLAAVVFDLLVTRWTVPWTALLTAVVLWQPFAKDFAHRFTTEQGLSLWWFRHPGTVGAVHLAWSAAVLLLVLAAPERLLHPRRRSRPAGPVDRRDG